MSPNPSLHEPDTTGREAFKEARKKNPKAPQFGETPRCKTLELNRCGTNVFFSMMTMLRLLMMMLNGDADHLEQAAAKQKVG